MQVKEIVHSLGLQVFSGEENLEKEVTGGIISDILSDVMAQASKGRLWVTNQTHENVVAIVFFKSLAAVILPGGLQPDEEAATKAREKKLPVLLTNLSAFEIVGKLYEIGIGKSD
ncbi:serine kinase [candidate division KSB1 bacterium]|nr:serine kinase [candidate division KSB1 bacterium]RQW06704.1 MAG: serine kinase [candidate division KSB1 bacterium]